MDKWVALTSKRPAFDEDFEYRIKPEPKKLELTVIETSKGFYWSCFYAVEQKDKDNIEMIFPRNKYKRIKDWFEVEYEDE